MKLLPLLLISCCCLFSQTLGQRQNAALIIGGYWARDAPTPVLDEVELFGCAGGNGASIRVENFPKVGYLMGGIYRNVEKDVLVCGGYSCAGTVCGIESHCFTYDPESGWRDDEVDSLGGSRWSYLMAHAPNMDVANDQVLHPLALGYTQMTEIYDEATNKWSNYKNVTDRSWYGLGCLYQDHGDNGNEYVYNVRTTVQRLDVKTWTFENLSSVPPAFQSPAKCAPVTINNQRGLFIRYGYFFNFASRTWVKKATPPYNPLVVIPNVIFSFRDRPTIFGNPVCDDMGICDNTEVLQYVPESDEWISLGHMTRPRNYQEVVEVPGEICDYFVTPTAEPTTTTTTRSTTTTTTSTTTTNDGERMVASLGITLVLLLLAL